MLSSRTQVCLGGIPDRATLCLKWRSSLILRHGRIRMAPASEKPSMKERILETADRLFYLQGLRAVGVDTIAAEIGISKRTLYNHFPSKDQLISAHLERRFCMPRPSDNPPAAPLLAASHSL